MSSKERANVIAMVAATTGRTRNEVLRILAPTWPMSAEDFQVLSAKLAQTPEPRDTELTRLARGAADHHVADLDAARVVADIAAYRRHTELKRENPHAAALAYQRHADSIERGRALETEDEGPEAA